MTTTNPTHDHVTEAVDDEVRLQEKRNSDMLAEVREELRARDGETPIDAIRRIREFHSEKRRIAERASFARVRARLESELAEALSDLPSVNSSWSSTRSGSGPHVVIARSRATIQVRTFNNGVRNFTPAEFQEEFEQWDGVTKSDAGESAPVTVPPTDPYPLRLTAVESEAQMQRLALASLRAELAALGKHVEDVELRAYMSPTGEALAALEGRHMARIDDLTRRIDAISPDFAPLVVKAVQHQTTTLEGRINALDQRITTVERQEAQTHTRVDVLARRAVEHDALAARVNRLASDVASLDALSQQDGATLKEHTRHATELADVQTAALAAMGDRVAELEQWCGDLCDGLAIGQRVPAQPNVANERALPRCDELGPVGARCVRARSHRGEHDDGSGVWTSPIMSKGAGFDVPLDLTTLRVPCAMDRAYVFRVRDGRLETIGDHDHVLAGPKLDVHGARLLARALTQWADGAEKGGGE